MRYYLPNNTILLVNMDNSDLNPMLVNTKKLKPYLCYDNNIIGPLSKFKGGKGEGITKVYVSSKEMSKEELDGKGREKRQ